MAAVDDPARHDVAEEGVFTPTGRRWTHGDSVRTVVAGAALLGSAAVAAQGLSPIEEEVYQAIYALPGAIYPLLWPVMQVGSLGGGMAIAVAMGLGTRRWSVGAFGVAAVGTSWVVAKVIKEVVKRGRPTAFELTTAFDRGAPDSGLGFVSGHATLAFALYAMAVPHMAPRWRLPALGVAGLVGVSRIFVGAHLPLDVVGAPPWGPSPARRSAGPRPAGEPVASLVCPPNRPDHPGRDRFSVWLWASCLDHLPEDRFTHPPLAPEDRRRRANLD